LDIYFSNFAFAAQAPRVHDEAVTRIEANSKSTLLEQARKGDAEAMGLRRLRRSPDRETTNPEAARLSESLRSGQFVDRATDPMKESSSAPACPDHGRPDTVRKAVIRSEGQLHAYFRAVGQLGAQIADALAYAHGQGILHRDIKPSNLLLDGHGAVWITDFGLAKAVASPEGPNEVELTCTGDIVGTLRYLAPERLNGDIDARGDVYSLGFTLYELLTLRPAFDEPDRTRLLRQVTEHEPIPPRKIDPLIPRDLETIVLKAGAKEPAARYPTAGELADDLRRFLENSPIRARRIRWSEQLYRWCRRKPGTAALLGSVLLLLTIIALGASGMSWQLRRSLVRAKEAEDRANLRLYDSLVAQARATRHSGKVGQRFDSLQALGEAAALARELALADRATMELRNEAIASLALMDLRRISEMSCGSGSAGSGLACDSDVQYVARAGSDQDAVILRVADGVEMARLPAAGRYFHGFRFSPDGQRLAILTPEGRTRSVNWLLLWEWKQGSRCSELASTTFDRTFDFTADGEVVFCNQAGVLHIVDPRSGHTVRQFQSMAWPWHLAVDAAGKRVALSSFRSSEVEVYDLATGQLAGKLPHPTYVGPMAWHPDGNVLATSCHDSRIHLWDVDARRPYATLLSQYSFGANGITFAADGNLLMSWAWDGVVRLWNPWTGHQLVSCPGVTAALSREGTRLVSRQGNMLVHWEVNPRHEYYMLANPPAPNGERLNYRNSDCGLGERWLAMGCEDGLRLWDLQRNRIAGFLPLGRDLHVAFRPNRAEVVCSDGKGLLRLPIRREQDRLLVGPPEKLPAYGNCRDFAFDGQGKIMAALSGQGLRLCDLVAPPGPGIVREHPGAAGLALSNDGQWAVSFPWNGRGVKVWDVRTGEFVCDLLPQTVIALGSFSPDSRWLVTATDKYRIWKVGSWDLVREIEREPSRDHPGCAVWSDDSKKLAMLFRQPEFSFWTRKPVTSRRIYRLPKRTRSIRLNSWTAAAALPASRTAPAESTSGSCRPSAKSWRSWVWIGMRQLPLPSVTARPSRSEWNLCRRPISRRVHQTRALSTHAQRKSQAFRHLLTEFLRILLQHCPPSWPASWRRS
jgi:WD40 repeat protein